MNHLHLRAVPWRVTFDTNPDDCNLRCIMCEQFSEFSPYQGERRAQKVPPRRMPVSLIENVVKRLAGKGLEEIIPSTMGEPLLYKDFDTILNLCHEYNVKLNLTTNGTFPRKSVLDWARLIVPVTSDVKISWNGATAATQESIMVGSNFEKGLKNIRDFIQVRDEQAKNGGNRCRITLQMTFIENNIHEIPQLIEFAVDLGVDRIKGHHLWAHFPEIEHLSMRRSPDSIKRWNRIVNLAHRATETHRLPSGQKILLDHFFPVKASSVAIAPNAICPFLGQEAWISATGRFDPCCAPDIQRRTLGDFGNLFETDFISIWTSDQYQRLLRDYLNYSLCKCCNMRKPVSE